MQKTENYEKRKEIIDDVILVLKGTDEKLKNREYLWNKVEQLENRKGAQLARDINI